MKVTFIATVFNEEESIVEFLTSLFTQTRKPSEIIIVDAGSTDNTFRILQNEKKRYRNTKTNFIILQKKGNRSVGRNTAIKKATGTLIAVSDAGCILNKDWLETIVSPFSDVTIDVVSGYYKPITKTVFQKALATYTCVMPDKLTDDFNPSSRSIAFRKTAWKDVGGYPEEFDTCEDMVFVKRLKEKGKRFFLARNALVSWRQKEQSIDAFWQFYSYAVGDGHALYIRKNTYILFLRYLVGVFLIYLGFVADRSWFIIIFFLLILYIVWSIQKNYRYVNDVRAFYLLPFLQFVSDISVILGTVRGLIKRIGDI